MEEPNEKKNRVLPQKITGEEIRCKIYT